MMTDTHFLRGKTIATITQSQQQGTFIKTKINTPGSIDYSILYVIPKYKLHLILYKQHNFKNVMWK